MRISVLFVLLMSVSLAINPVRASGLALIQQGEATQVFSGDAVDDAPLRLQCPYPGLPLDFRSSVAEAEGNGTFVVGTDGRVDVASIEVTATHEVLAFATRTLVSQCSFRPGLVDGQPARVQMEMPVVFSRGIYRYSTRVAGPVIVAEPAVPPEVAMAEITEWFESNLSDFGSFSVRLTADMAESMFATGRGAGERAAMNRATEIRHRTTDVSVEDCSLLYTSTYQFVGGDPYVLQWMIPFAAIDPATVRVQQLELPYEIRALQSRSEVYLHSLPGQYFVVTIPEERTPRSSLEHSIPIGSQNDAQLVIEQLRVVLPLCRRM